MSADKYFRNRAKWLRAETEFFENPCAVFQRKDAETRRFAKGALVCQVADEEFPSIFFAFLCDFASLR